MTALKRLIGPRMPDDLSAEKRALFQRPTILWITAAVLLIISIFLPYWKMTLLAPQYPGGLHVITYVNRLEGDVMEIDGLNHYIGMRPLGEAAQLERAVSIVAISVLAMLVLGAIFIHTKYAVLLTLPAILMPFIFLADMYYWMRNFGMNLDETAALSSIIEPFVPPIWGSGFVGQFETIASFELGLELAFLSSLLIVIGLYFHRKAYKPLVDGM